MIADEKGWGDFKLMKSGGVIVEYERGWCDNK